MKEDGKNIQRTKKRILVNVFTVLFVFLFISCGTDIYYSLEPPSLVSSPSTDPVSRYFCFYTNDSNNSSLDVFLGTAVYYKIYNNTSTMNSDISSINLANKEYSSDGVNRLLSLGYQPMTSSSTTDDPLFPVSTSNRKIRIRLFTEGSGDLYAEGIFINDSPSSWGNPQRFDRSHSFNFTDSSMIPSLSDLDVKGTQNEGTTSWYVNAYAVSTGKDMYLANLYSQVIHLGYIVINTP